VGPLSLAVLALPATFFVVVLPALLLLLVIAGTALFLRPRRPRTRLASVRAPLLTERIGSVRPVS